MGDISSETSMEDILSSIKRIIAEEGEAAVHAPRTRKPAGRAPIESVRPLTPPPAAMAAHHDDDDVLDLDGFPAPPPPARAQAEQPRTHIPPAPEPVIAAPVADAPAPSILSDRAVEASTRSLESLARVVVKPEVSGGETIEGLVREMLRPMLRDWLDANLPMMVEAMVAREISRITGRD